MSGTTRAGRFLRRGRVELRDRGILIGSVNTGLPGEVWAEVYIDGQHAGFVEGRGHMADLSVIWGKYPQEQYRGGFRTFSGALRWIARHADAIKRGHPLDA